MIYLRLPVVIFMLGMYSCFIAQTGSLTACRGKNSYKNKDWYQPMLNELSKFPLVDRYDAPLIRSLSSNAWTWKQTPEIEIINSIINSAGNVTEKSILFICNVDTAQI